MKVRTTAVQKFENVDDWAHWLVQTMPPRDAAELGILKRLMGRFGVQPWGWRCLVDYWEEIIGSLQAAGMIVQSRPLASFENLCAYLVILQEAELATPIPQPVLLACVKAVRHHTDADWHDVPPSLLMSLCKHYWRFRANSKRTGKLLHDDLPALMRWLFRDTCNGYEWEETRFREGWDKLWAAYREWKARCRHDACADPEWSKIFPPKIVNSLLVVELCSRDQLCEEAEVMRHCVDRMGLLCMDGEYRAFSLRDPKTNERQATLGLRCEGAQQWVLDDLRLQDNEPPEEEHQRIADAVLSEVNRVTQLRYQEHLDEVQKLFDHAIAMGHWPIDHAYSHICEMNDAYAAAINKCSLADIQAIFVRAHGETSFSVAYKAQAMRLTSLDQLRAPLKADLLTDWNG